MKLFFLKIVLTMKIGTYLNPPKPPIFLSGLSMVMFRIPPAKPLAPPLPSASSKKLRFWVPASIASLTWWPRPHSEEPQSFSTKTLTRNCPSSPCLKVQGITQYLPSGSKIRLLTSRKLTKVSVRSIWKKKFEKKSSSYNSQNNVNSPSIWRFLFA